MKSNDGKDLGEYRDVLIQRHHALSIDQLNNVVSGSVWLFIFGYISYQDVWGGKHRRGFIKCWSPKTRVYVDVRAYPKYDYQIEEM